MRARDVALVRTDEHLHVGGDLQGFRRLQARIDSRQRTKQRIRCRVVPEAEQERAHLRDENLVVKLDYVAALLVLNSGFAIGGRLDGRLNEHAAIHLILRVGLTPATMTEHRAWSVVNIGELPLWMKRRVGYLSFVFSSALQVF